MGRVTFPERAAEIDLDALRHNIRHLRDVAPPARVMAVVKADAYGHGALPVARAALAGGSLVGRHRPHPPGNAASS